MKALIDPRFAAKHITSWNGNVAIFTEYANSSRVCQVEENEFEVASPLYWADCTANVTADGYYRCTLTNNFFLCENTPQP